MTQRSANLAVAVVFLAIGAGQIFFALRLPGGGLAEPGPNLFPMLAGTLMLVAAALAVPQELFRHAPGRLGVREHLPAIAGIALAIAAFALLLPRLGFGPSAFLLLSALLRLFGLKRPILLLALAAAMTLASFLLFDRLLGVRFPDAQWLR